jgi:hypothetical protein
MDLAGQGGPASTVHGFTGGASLLPMSAKPGKPADYSCLRTQVTGLVGEILTAPSECQSSACEPRLSKSGAFFVRSDSQAVLSQISA